MRQTMRNRPPVFPGETARRVASSDTRHFNAYQDAIAQNRAAAKATSQTRQANVDGKEPARSIGSRPKIGNAVDLLSVGHEKQEGAKLSTSGEQYQSSLLTRFIKQPTMPSSHSIHSALSHERVNGWPTLGPVRQTAIGTSQRNFVAASGIPRPSINKQKKSTPSRVPSLGPPGARKSESKTKYAFQTPINYHNEQEIMRKIFGSKRTTSQHHNLTAYSQNAAAVGDLESRQRQSPEK